MQCCHHSGISFIFPCFKYRKVIPQPVFKEEGHGFFSKLYHSLCFRLAEAVLCGDDSEDILLEYLAASKSFHFPCIFLTYDDTVNSFNQYVESFDLLV